MTKKENLQKQFITSVLLLFYLLQIRLNNAGHIVCQCKVSEWVSSETAVQE